MDYKGKGTGGKYDPKGVSRQRPPRNEDQKMQKDDGKKVSVGRRAPETRHKPRRVTNSLPVQQKTVVTTTTNWVRGGSSLSFADVVRKNTDSAAFVSHVKRADEKIVEDEPMGHDVVDMMHEVIDKKVGGYPLSNENDEITYSSGHQDSAVVQPSISTSQEEVDEVPPIKYYVLEIDRILEESVMLPPHATAIAADYVGFCTFSGQVGKPPAAPPIQQQFYRPDAATMRSFPGMGGTSDMGRSQHWAPQSGHSVDYANTNWSLQERGQRGFHQGLQYNSYAPPVQQSSQRTFIPSTVNRMLQNEISDASLRQLRDVGAFSRHSGNSGGVW